MSAEIVQAGWMQIDGVLVPLQPGVVADIPHSATPQYDVIVGLIQSNIRGAATDYDVVADQYSSADIAMWNWTSESVVSASEPLSSPPFRFESGHPMLDNNNHEESIKDNRRRAE